MTTIIRVKRSRQGDPVDALVLACKRRKTEDVASAANGTDSFETVLNFSGTVEEKDDIVAANTVVSNTRISPAAQPYKTHVPNITSKKRKEWKARTDDNRFKVVSCLRALNVSETLDSSVQSEDGKNLTIVDVSLEDDEADLPEESPSGYVYDLYSTQFEHGDDLNDLYIDNLVSIHPLGMDMEYRCGEDYDEDGVDPYDEDSNDENNWRNEYPDTDSSIDEDDMRLANKMKGFGLDDGYDLSSDSGEEDHPNFDGSNGAYRFKSYEDYKKQMIAELEGLDEYESTRDEGEDSYELGMSH